MEGFFLRNKQNEQKSQQTWTEWFCTSKAANFTSNACFKGSVACGLTLMRVLNPWVGIGMLAFTGINTAINMGINYNRNDSATQTALRICNIPAQTMLATFGPKLIGNAIEAYTGLPLGVVGEIATFTWATKDILFPVCKTTANVAITTGKFIKNRIDYNNKLKQQKLNENHQYQGIDDEYDVIGGNIKINNVEQINNNEQIANLNDEDISDNIIFTRNENILYNYVNNKELHPQEKNQQQRYNPNDYLKNK